VKGTSPRLRAIVEIYQQKFVLRIRKVRTEIAPPPGRVRSCQTCCQLISKITPMEIGTSSLVKPHNLLFAVALEHSEFSCSSPVTSRP